MKRQVEKIVKQIINGTFEPSLFNIGSERAFRFFWASLLAEESVTHIEGDNLMHHGYKCRLADGRIVMTLGTDEWDEVYFIAVSN